MVVRYSDITDKANSNSYNSSDKIVIIYHCTVIKQS